MKYFKSNFFWIMILLFIASTPYLFTQFFTGIDFNTTGQIGDTIGGITAPFINIAAAILVYLSFKEQIKANKLLSKESSYNFIDNLYKNGFEDEFITNQLRPIDIYVFNQNKYAEKHVNYEESKVRDSLVQLIIIVDYYKSFFIELKESSLSETIKKTYFQNFMNSKHGLLFKVEFKIKELFSKEDFTLSKNLEYSFKNFSEALIELDALCMDSYQI